MLDTQPLWTNTQLHLEAEAIVAGRYGIDAVYGVLRRMRDDLLAVRAQMAQQPSARPLSEWTRLELPDTPDVRHLFGQLIMSVDVTGEHGPYAFCRRTLAQQPSAGMDVWTPIDYCINDGLLELHADDLAITIGLDNTALATFGWPTEGEYAVCKRDAPLPAQQPSAPVALICDKCNDYLEAPSYCEICYDTAVSAWREAEAAQQQPNVPQADWASALEALQYIVDRYLSDYGDNYEEHLARWKVASTWLDEMQQPPAMPAPDWANAPEWAEFWARDSNGKAHWYEREPSWIDLDGEWGLPVKWNVQVDDSLDGARWLQRRPRREGE